MKRLLILSVLVLALVTTLLLAAGPVAAKATKFPFTAEEKWVAKLDDGVVWYTGKGEKIWHVRDRIIEFEIVGLTGDDRVEGVETVTINLDMQIDPETGNPSGPMRGTFRIESDGGYWEGTWTGVRDDLGYAFFKYVGKGGGDYAGLQLRLDSERLDPSPAAPYHWTGYILDPGK